MHTASRPVTHHMDKSLAALLENRRYEQQMLAFLASEYGPLSETEKLVCAFISLFEEQGHVSLPLDLQPWQWGEVLEMEPEQVQTLKGVRFERRHLEQSALFGGTDTHTPFWLEGNRVAFRRLRQYEQDIVRWIGERVLAGKAPAHVESVADAMRKGAKYIKQLFAESAGNAGSDAAPDWQQVAVANSLLQRFLIISGGPGTGKTTTIARLIRLHLDLSDRPLRIELAAPTGKAAGRMGESLFGQLAAMNIKPEEHPGLPGEARTIHRMLARFGQEGLLQLGPRPTLDADILVVDEASMIDLLTMHRLMRHLGEHTLLVLLGDRDQLASVEAGAVFSDLCRKTENGFSSSRIRELQALGVGGELPQRTVDTSPFDDAIVYLTKSYRFQEHSGIGKLARLVKTRKYEQSLVGKVISEAPDLEHRAFSFTKDDISALANSVVKRIEHAAGLHDAAEMLRYWKQEIWLLALRRGLTGSDQLNRFVEERYRRQAEMGIWQEWYAGRPVIITQNDYSLGIFNGDSGVCIHDEQGTLVVQIETGSQLKRFLPDQLKHYRPAYFLTVHKSQGSEFDVVHLLLPREATPVFTRELVYTAITRARTQCVLHGDAEMLMAGMRRETVRFTGLEQSLCAG